LVGHLVALARVRSVNDAAVLVLGLDSSHKSPADPLGVVANASPIAAVRAPSTVRSPDRAERRNDSDTLDERAFVFRPFKRVNRV